MKEMCSAEDSVFRGCDSLRITAMLGEHFTPEKDSCLLVKNNITLIKVNYLKLDIVKYIYKTYRIWNLTAYRSEKDLSLKPYRIYIFQT